mgnify:CR=1 FL=1
MTPQAFATYWHGSQVRKYVEHCREIVEILKGAVTRPVVLIYFLSTIHDYNESQHESHALHVDCT